MSFEYEDFDEADALMAAIFENDDEGCCAAEASNNNNTNNNNNNNNNIAADDDSNCLEKDTDLTTMYESGMMRSVHMQMQENAKIPNLLSISIDRSNTLSETATSTLERSPPTAEKFLKSSQRESAALNYSVAGTLAQTPTNNNNYNYYYPTINRQNHQGPQPQHVQQQQDPTTTTAQSFHHPSYFSNNCNNYPYSLVPVMILPSNSMIPPPQQQQQPTTDNNAPPSMPSVTYVAIPNNTQHHPYQMMMIPTNNNDNNNTNYNPISLPQNQLYHPQQHQPQQPQQYQQRQPQPQPQPQPNQQQPVTATATTTATTLPLEPPTGCHHHRHHHSISGAPRVNKSDVNTLPSIRASTSAITTPASSSSQIIINNAATTITTVKKNINNITPFMTNCNFQGGKTTTMPKINNTTTRQNQFGFGNNHIVPSVPIPPSTYVQQVRRQQQEQQKSSASTALSVSATSNNNNTTPDVAYERKKQKAKSSRIQLNDSIDRLSIAINLAQTQSRKRSEQTAKYCLLPTTCNLMKQCEEINALKHDRPSFLGAAATIIQVLNDQCEALLDEIRGGQQPPPQVQPTNIPASFRTATTTSSVEIVEATTAAADVPMDSSNSSSDIVSQVSLPHHHHGSPQTKKLKRTSTFSATAESATKNVGSGSTTTPMPITAITTTTSNIDVFSCILAHGPVLKLLSLFLDPTSLGRCRSVCRSWYSIEGLTSDRTWYNLCTKRFGERQIESWNTATTTTTSTNMMQLYHDMSNANIQPFCRVIDDDDSNNNSFNVKLGQAKVDGVSAWASVMSRSNGETLRSVKKKEGSTSTRTAAAVGRDGDAAFSAIPVVELRIIVQNTGIQSTVTIPTDQSVTVDLSTRRRHEELTELISSDKRFLKQVLTVDGIPVTTSNEDDDNMDANTSNESSMYRLSLFDSVVLQVYIHAKGCCTTSKFLQKAQFTKLLVKANSKTWAVVIPFSSTTNDNERTTLCIKKRGMEEEGTT